MKATISEMLNPEMILAAYHRLAGRSDALSAKREATRQRIVAAATDAFCSRGLRRVAMEEIAEEANVSRGTLYTYAKTKDDLLLMCLGEEGLRLFGMSEALFDPTLTPQGRIETLIIVKLKAAQSSPLLARIMDGDLELVQVLQSHPTLLAAFGQNASNSVSLVPLLAAATEGRVDDAELAAAAAAITSVIASGPTIIKNAESLGDDVDAMVAALARLLTDGLFGHPRRQRMKKRTARTKS